MTIYVTISEFAMVRGVIDTLPEHEALTAIRNYWPGILDNRKFGETLEFVISDSFILDIRKTTTKNSL
jgi:hypothetical protein